MAIPDKQRSISPSDDAPGFVIAHRAGSLPESAESGRAGSIDEARPTKLVPSQTPRQGSRLSGWMFVGLLFIVMMPFLFWRMTWFGGRLSDAEMDRYLRDTSVPHKTQHALSQLADEIARGSPAAKARYPELIALATSPEPQFRLMAAWAMGQDPTSQEFHQALLKLLQDSVPMVRWNAALALIRFGDAAGEPQIKFMLRPYTLIAPQDGTLSFSAKEHDDVRAGGLVARIETGKEAGVEVRSPLGGELERELKQDSNLVKAGDEIATVSPGEDQVWEALRALYVVGRPDDIEDVDRFAAGVSGMPERVRVQARLAAEAIRSRAETPQSPASAARREPARQ